jgi:hypothetical protein
MACYVDHGQPEPQGQGCYNPLALLADRYQDFTGRAGRRADGHGNPDAPAARRTAASLVYAGQPATAVSVAGHGRRVGFPPPSADGLRPLADRVTIR